MQDLNSIGKTLVIIGIITAIIGGVVILAGKSPWIGKLPGDIYIKKENFTFYFPITTSIIVSIILSVLLWLFSKR